MAIEKIDTDRILRASRVDGLVRRRVEEERAREATEKRSRADSQGSALSIMDGIVRGHEREHLSVLGGAAAGPIVYSFVSGPQGSYASGGAIKVDLQPVPGDPEATLRKAERIRQAALAPSNPSSADLRVAARAYALEVRAKREMAESESASGPAKEIPPAL
jgi:hypothetical protein